MKCLFSVYWEIIMQAYKRLFFFHSLLKLWLVLCFTSCFPSLKQMSTLLGFTWVFGFVAAFANVTALWYIFIILNSLQGVYIFIAFICNKRVFELWRDSCTCLDRVSSTSSSKSRATSSDVVTMKKSDRKTTTSESMLWKNTHIMVSSAIDYHLYRDITVDLQPNKRAQHETDKIKKTN